MRAVVCGCGAMAKGWLRAIAETPNSESRCRNRRFGRSRSFDRGGARRRIFPRAMPSSEAISNRVLETTRPDLVFDIVIPSRASPCRQHCACAWLPCAQREADGCLDRGGRRADRAGAPGRPQSMRSSRTAASYSGSAPHPPASSKAAGSANSPASIAISSSAPHFGGFREEMDNVLLLDMAIHTFDAARFVSGQGAAGGLLPRKQSARLVVRAWRRGQRDLRVFRRCASLPIAAPGAPRVPAPAGKAVAGHRHQGHAALGRRRRNSDAHVVSGETGFLRDSRARSTVPEPVTRGGHSRPCQRHRRFSRLQSEPASRRKRTAMTISRALPWCSGRSKAPDRRSA